MSIYIDKNKCIGCGKCAEICPGNLLQIKNRRAEIRDVRDCWGCTACVKICPKNAIYYQLSADLGGAGSKLSVKNSQTNLTWIVNKSNGEIISINIDKTQSNKY
ncbi:MAG: 4Fe-4S binding protein [Selenomonadaceae bacterium]|nr:4Fe-4S binding protein [Selenomonadaceae bacterium]